MNQIRGVQVWRAVAVLMVTAGHVNQVVAPPTVTVSLWRFGNLSMFGVDIFFIISGFILGSTALRAAGGDRRVQAYDFIARRIMRVFPIYWIVILFPLSRLLRQHRLTGFSFLNYWLLLPGLRFPVVMPVIGIAWTLIFEMVFYYIMATFMRISLRRAVPYTIATLFVMVLAGGVVDIRRPVLIILMNPILLEFVLGGVTAVAYQRFGKRKYTGIGILIAGVAATAVLSVRVTYNLAVEQNVLVANGVLWRVGTWGVAAWLLVSGVVFWGPQVSSKLGSFLVALGNGSYSIYLTSAVSLEMIHRSLAKVAGGVLDSRFSLGWKGAALILVVSAGMLFYQIVEKPLSKRLGSAYSSAYKGRLTGSALLGVKA